jgi:hypothetical protein
MVSFWVGWGGAKRGAGCGGGCAVAWRLRCVSPAAAPRVAHGVAGAAFGLPPAAWQSCARIDARSAAAPRVACSVAALHLVFAAVCFVRVPGFRFAWSRAESVCPLLSSNVRTQRGVEGPVWRIVKRPSQLKFGIDRRADSGKVSLAPFRGLSSAGRAHGWQP